MSELVVVAVVMYLWHIFLLLVVCEFHFHRAMWFWPIWLYPCIVFWAFKRDDLVDKYFGWTVD